jgi:hypothetical protein
LAKKGNAMKNFMAMQKKYIEKCGEIKTPDMITDIIPSGVTVMYGASGVGKTYSLVKHLNRNGIKPILIDFDNNSKVAEELDVEYADGYWQINMIRESIDRRLKAQEDARNELIKKMREFLTNVDRSNKEKKIENYLENGIDKFKTDYPEAEWFNEYWHPLRDAIANNKILKSVESFYDFENQYVIIDTYAKSKSVFDEDEFVYFVNNLKSKNNNIAVIAHSTGERDKYVDMPEVFVNHADCRLKLHKDISKKVNDQYLIIEKLRGYKGEPIIKNWEL